MTGECFVTDYFSFIRKLDLHSGQQKLRFKYHYFTEAIEKFMQTLKGCADA
jgi:hypothetical protein